MKVLLVYFLCPEQVKFVLLDNPTKAELHTLAIAHNQMVNFDDLTPEQDLACQAISDAIGKPEDASGTSRADWPGRWLEKELNPKDLPDAGPFDKVFYTGFGL